MTSNIPKRIHRFWNRLAILSGIYLIIDGSVAIFPLDAFMINDLWGIIRIVMGTTVIIVDSWFLAHV